MNDSHLILFFDWWISRDPTLAEQLFHEEITYTNTLGHEYFRDTRQSGTLTNTATPILIKCVQNGNEAILLFEETDQVTLLNYRYAVYLRFEESKVIEMIETKEIVMNR
jgi:hypothetical protein